MGRAGLFVLWGGCVLLQRVRASNWAQTTGLPKQNNIVPRMPSPGILSSKLGSRPGKNDHWSARQGMGVVTVPMNASARREAMIFVLGGDSYVRQSQFQQHGGQYMNDVWYTSGVEWHTTYDREVKNKYGAPLFKIYARMEWHSMNGGVRPPGGISYDEWIQCQAAFAHRNDTLCADTANYPGAYVTDNMWSPRRELGVAHLQGALYVLGGRARWFGEVDREDQVGGVLGDVRVAQDQFASVVREPSVLLNDVWKSTDWGLTWTLVTAGCKAPQLDQILRGNVHEGMWGSQSSQCVSDSDCYGNEVCNTTLSACVCQMWSPREQHAVITDDTYMYVLGGFTSPQKSYCGPYACGDPWASAYTGFMHDIWRSKDGKAWEVVTLSAAWPGRGGHQAVLSSGQVFVVGGETGVTVDSRSTRFLSDVWAANITDLASWRLEWSVGPWPGRARHAVVIEPPTAANAFLSRMVVMGGENDKGPLADVWVRPLLEGGEWAMDYTSQQMYSHGSGSTFRFGPGSPQQYYYDANTPIESIIKHWLPKDDPNDIVGVIQPYLTQDEVRMLHQMKIFTVRDMANADQRTILNLRGWDYTQVKQEDRMTFYGVCDFRALCIAMLNKCKVDRSLAWQDGERERPLHVTPRFRKGWPKVQHAKWYGVDYTTMNPNVKPATETDPDKIIAAWDGCSRLPSSIPATPDIPGIGPVSQVDSIRDPIPYVNELQCRVTPLPRTSMVAGYLQDRVWLFGGRQGFDEIDQDSWYRDDRLPSAFLTTGPKSKTSQSIFRVTADEDGCYFEYRIYLTDNWEEVRGWTKSASKIDVSFLNVREGGPGTGNYIFYVRAVDPASNRDFTFIRGQNMWVWKYQNPHNWGLILGLSAAGLVVVVALYLEYRRRMKKRAMERYALKRMRRKFKGMQKDIEKGKAVDWRDMRKKKKKVDKRVEIKGGGAKGTKNKSPKDKTIKKKRKAKKS